MVAVVAERHQVRLELLQQMAELAHLVHMVLAAAASLQMAELTAVVSLGTQQ